MAQAKVVELYLAKSTTSRSRPLKLMRPKERLPPLANHLDSSSIDQVEELDIYPRQMRIRIPRPALGFIPTTPRQFRVHRLSTAAVAFLLTSYFPKKRIKAPTQNKGRPHRPSRPMRRTGLKAGLIKAHSA